MTAALTDGYRRGESGFARIALALFLAGFSTFSLIYCVQPLMPVFASDYGISATQSSLSLSVSTICLAVGMLFTGPLSDAYGRKRVMLMALFAATLATLCCALSTTWPMFLLFRALVGLSLSGVAAVGMSYLSEEISMRHLAYAMGLYVSGNGIGSLTGRLLGGVLVDWLNWRVVMGLMAAVSLLVATIFAYALPRSTRFIASPLNLAYLVGGISAHCRDKGLRLLFLQGFLLMGVFVALFNYITYRLLEPPFSFSQAWVGLVFVVTITGIIGASHLSAMADRFGLANMFIVVVTIQLIGVLCTLSSHIVVALPGLCIFTLGFYGAHSIASGWVGQRATHAKALGSSLYLFFYYLGSSVAGTAGGIFWQAFNWRGVVFFVSAMLMFSLWIATKLKRLD